MKIAIIGSRGYPYIYSGYETFVRELSERLVKSGMDVTIYCHRNLFKEFPDELNGIKLIFLPTVERKNLSQLIHSFQSMLHASFSDYDVILTVNVANAPLGIFSRIFKKKTVLNVDGLEWLRPKWKGLGSKYFFLAARFATRLFDTVVTDSFQMQRIYREKFGVNSEMIAYGANIRYSRKEQLIRQFGLAKDGYFLLVGRIIPDNNFDFVVDEFCLSGSGRKLVIVGDGLKDDRFTGNLKNNRDSRLIFTGYVRDQEVLSELYLNSFAYLHGHEFGGTNPSLLEALGCGCAVMALDTPFSREMLKGGEFGVFFRKERGNLSRLIDSSESDTGILSPFKLKARNRIEEEYSWDKISQQYMELFKRIASKNA